MRGWARASAVSPVWLMSTGVSAVCAALVAMTGVAVGAQQRLVRDVPIPHDVGQSVSPSFEGWFENPDGTFTLSWGYFNRNYEERPDLAVGPTNRFDPGPADRGQPTHFLPRRQTGVFTTVVPADFGDQTLTWTIVRGGETIAIPGHLRPEWVIDAMMEAPSKNTPPALRAVGLSRPKADYCRHMAEAVASGRLDLGGLADLDDTAAFEALVAVKGIGRWTAEIYLLFSLDRRDVWPAHDVALQVAVERLKRLEARPTVKQMDAIACRWAPWRGVAAQILWRYYRVATGRADPGR